MKSAPSNLPDHLGFWLRKLSNQVSDAFAARLEKHGATVPQWVVLRVLFDYESLPLKDIVAQVGVDQGSLSRMVERLIARGWVDRIGSPEDRRAVAISLTPEGRRLVPKLAHEADENDRLFFHDLTTPQRKALLQTIQHLIAQNGGDTSGMPLR